MIAHLFNNTFIQSWDPYPDDGVPQFSALPWNVAICDVTDPVCDVPMAEPDPNPELRGLSRPNIQNNLIRAIGTDTPTALMGIDLSDVSVAVGTRLGPSNAFDPDAVPLAAENFSNGVYCSRVLGADPLPRTNAQGVVLNPNAQRSIAGNTDPAFVGEMLTSVSAQLSSQGSPTIPTDFGRDWRLMPDSIYIDEGSAPLNDVLQAQNGTAHNELACTASASFDFDGEVYGNSRVVAAVLSDAVPFPDIGYDEVGILIDTHVINDSVDHTAFAVPAPVTPPGYTNVHFLIYPASTPAAGAPAADSHLFAAVTTAPLPAVPYAAYTIMPGAIAPAIDSNALLGSNFILPWNFFWMNITAINPQIGLVQEPLFRLNYVSGFDGTNHVFSLGFIPQLGLGTSGSYMVEQAIYFPSNGIFQGAQFLSNLQTVHD